MRVYASYIQIADYYCMEQTRKTEHFKVPEGYFENFTKQMMAQLPEQVDMPVRKKTISVLWSRVAVSIAVVLAFTATWYALESYNLYEEMADAGNGIYGTEYTIDELEEYAMLDHQDIYRIISE